MAMNAFEQTVEIHTTEQESIAASTAIQATPAVRTAGDAHLGR
jgi:hypothetical protein